MAGEKPCPILLLGVAYLKTVTFQKEVFQFKFAMNSGSFDSGQFYIVQIINGLNWFNQPVVGNVVMHSENRLFRQIIELGDRS